jgi:minor extracellular protease Epr
MKRTLALVLALVMAIGLVAFPASASDFKDDKDVQYAEAVDVVSAAGIINGFEDVSFQPRAI